MLFASLSEVNRIILLKAALGQRMIVFMNVASEPDHGHFLEEVELKEGLDGATKLKP